ncbi:GntR family transcriptional regulator [Amycolatopsis alkalitolerans]|uniref:Winged helix-turn-helix transcriptional regulator n=1 Tax=Amycolatopsis alkalitolerans TaxID=2547244 RepID=A0A5C4LWA7_9PSEU|nr:winged helix-turn-helix domain-containing protein [Amycolatopsis alkalitolerans]TNC22231.1 winged helix-turn-helix transcriptional regulator [Amycolatopsis alkalitolerans]
MPSRDHSGERKADRSGRIIREGPATIWGQVAKDLIARIKSGEFPPHSRLPNENEMARDYGVARDTLRAAKKHLVEEGYLEVTQGRGTFVRANRRKRAAT